MSTTENILSAIIDFNSKLKGLEQAAVPCLIGPTGTGKTTRIQQEAERRGLPVFRLLLQTMLPEDVLGLPRVVGKPGQEVTTWSLPTWADELRKRPGILFLDEEDKARPECMSAVLTLKAEKRLRDIVLHPGTIIVSAMQPVSAAEWLSDQTGQAMSARTCFIPVTQEWKFLENKFDLDLNFLPKDSKVELPILPRPSPRQVDWFINFCRHNPKDKEMWESVACGMFPKDVSDALIETVSKGTQVGGITRADLVELLKEDGVKLIDKLTIPELVLLAPDTFHYGTPETIKRSYIRVWSEGDEDAAKNYLENQFNVILERIKENGGKLDVCAGASQEEVQKALEEAAYIIGSDFWAKRGGEQETEKGLVKKAQKKK